MRVLLGKRRDPFVYLLGAGWMSLEHITVPKRQLSSDPERNAFDSAGSIPGGTAPHPSSQAYLRSCYHSDAPPFLSASRELRMTCTKNSGGRFVTTDYCWRGSKSDLPSSTDPELLGR